MAAWLETSELSFGYEGQSPIFENLDLRVESTTPLGICGRSGIGKTTLLNLVAGTVQPTRGVIRFNAQPILAPSSERALVFQSYNLFPWLTSCANVEFGMRYMGVSKLERRRRALELLSGFELADAADRYPHQLSGGMRQRVGIARALAVEPKCLLLDEPFAALDSETKAQIIGILKDAIKRADMRVVVVSHDVDDITELCGQFLMLKPSGNVTLIPLHQETRTAEIMRIRAEYATAPAVT